MEGRVNNIDWKALKPGTILRIMFIETGESQEREFIDYNDSDIGSEIVVTSRLHTGYFCFADNNDIKIDILKFYKEE